MAFALPRISRPQPGPKPKAKPAYSPQTEQEITQAMFDLALAGPRWIGEQMGEDLDEAFEVGDTGVSVSEFIKHPIKTTKSTLRKWTVSKWKNMLNAQLAADYVWKPRLDHFLAKGSIQSTAERDTILDWVSKPEGYARDIAYEQVEILRGYGWIDDDVWAGIKRHHSWDEFSRFRRKPGRYLWEKTFGKRGTKEAPFYKYSPQKWLGEPLGKALAKTGLGKAVAGVKQELANVAKTVVGTSKKLLKETARAVGKVAVQSARWVVTKVAGTATWTAISSAVGGLVGSVGGPVGTVIGFLAGPAVTKLTEWTIKIACLGCGCATLMFAGTMISIIISIWAAFRPPEMGGAGPTALVEVVKTASPTHIDSGATGMAAEVSYTIEVKNKTNKEITDGTLVDTHDPADFLISVWANGDWVNGVGTWSGITIPPNGSFTVNPKGFIQNTNTDKVVVNNASFTGTLDGDSVSAGGSAVVIVGNPVGQPPSGWPVDEGCISQGFNVTSDPNASHYGKDMVDIAPKVAGSSGQPIYATHDGRAYAHYGDPTYGNYVIVVSANFQTRYAHLISIDPAVDVSGGADVVPGQPLGGMGNSGKSTATHLHYDVRDTKTGALVTSQYIPDSSFDGCVERGPCHCCFSGFDGACGSAP